jgi:hypothetical protein
MNQVDGSYQFDRLIGNVQIQEIQRLNYQSQVSTLTEIRRVLKPGGIACLVDVDDDWVMFYPCIASMVTFQQQVVKAQQEQGGDPHVGRKLGSYLASAGFGRIKTAIKIVSSDLLQDTLGQGVGFKAFLDLLSFGAGFCDRHPDLIALGALAKSDAYQLLELPYAWAGFGLFVVTGCLANFD